MSPAQGALRAALYERLTADGALTALLGGPRVFDMPPHGAAFPYLILEWHEVRPLAADAPGAAEHRLDLRVWSRAGGKAEAGAILDAAARALEDVGPALDGHRLALLTLERAEIDRARDGRTYRAAARLRAVTEPREGPA